jgi:RNA polymerase sigma factor (sigma-70 family)
LGEFPEMKRRTRILVPSRELTLLNCDAPMLDHRQGHRHAIELSGPTRTQRKGSSIVSRTAPPWRQAAQADRQAFDRALAPTYPELLQAAQRELRHRLTLGQFAPDNPTPEQLLDMALQRVWRERRRLSSTLGIKAFALASIFRTAEALAAREDERSRTTTELFPEEVEPDPLYENDDDFWQSHELEYPKNSQVFSGTVDRAREDVAEEDEFVGWLAPREREVLLMHEVHGVPLQEVALALGITPAEAEGLLASARRRVRAADKAAH